MICEQNKHNAISEKKSTSVCWYLCEKLLISGWKIGCSTVIVVLCGRTLQSFSKAKSPKNNDHYSLNFLYSPMSHHSNNSTTLIDKLLSKRENITLISFHLAAMQKAWLINVRNEGYKSVQVFGSKGNLSLLCNCGASHITGLFSALAINNSPHQS